MSGNYKTGKVLQVNGETALVRLQHALTCSGADPGCPYNAMFFGVTTAEYLTVEAKNTINARVGDYVTVLLPSGNLMQAVGYVYGTLFIAFIVSLLAGHGFAVLLHLKDAGPMIGSVIIVMSAALFLIRKLDKKYSPEYKIVKIVDAQELTMQNGVSIHNYIQ